MSARTYKMSEFKILTLCAGRTPEQVEEALRLLDNREKVVEKLEDAHAVLEVAKGDSDFRLVVGAMNKITAALSLLEKGGEG